MNKFKKNNPEYFKKYYAKNKDKIIQRMREKVHCDVCNKDICRASYRRHCNGKVHKTKEEEQKTLMRLVESLQEKTEALEQQLQTHLRKKQNDLKTSEE